jgi:hypothetical protein
MMIKSNVICIDSLKISKDWSDCWEHILGKLSWESKWLRSFPNTLTNSMITFFRFSHSFKVISQKKILLFFSQFKTDRYCLIILFFPIILFVLFHSLFNLAKLWLISYLNYSLFHFFHQEVQNYKLFFRSNTLVAILSH